MILIKDVQLPSQQTVMTLLEEVKKLSNIKHIESIIKDIKTANDPYKLASIYSELLVILSLCPLVHEIDCSEAELPNGRKTDPTLVFNNMQIYTEVYSPWKEKYKFITGYLFSWDVTSENVNKELAEYMRQKLGAGKITIEKLDDNTKKVSINGKFLLLKLNDEKTEVKVEIYGKIIDKLITDTENKKLNICKRPDTAEIKSIEMLNEITIEKYLDKCQFSNEKPHLFIIDLDNSMTDCFPVINGVSEFSRAFSCDALPSGHSGLFHEKDSSNNYKYENISAVLSLKNSALDKFIPNPNCKNKLPSAFIELLQSACHSR